MNIFDRAQAIIDNAKEVYFSGEKNDRSINDYAKNFKNSVIAVGIFAAVSSAAMAQDQNSIQDAQKNMHDANIAAFDKSIELDNLNYSAQGLIDAEKVVVVDSNNSSHIKLDHSSLNVSPESIAGLQPAIDSINNTGSPLGVSSGKINNESVPIFIVNKNSHGVEISSILEKIEYQNPGKYTREDFDTAYKAFTEHELMHIKQDIGKKDFFNSCINSASSSHNVSEGMNCIANKVENTNQKDMPLEISPDLKEIISNPKDQTAYSIILNATILEEAKADVYAALIAKQAGNSKITDLLIDMRSVNTFDRGHYTKQSLEDSKSITTEQLQGLSKKEIAAIAENIANRNETVYGKEHRDQFKTSIEIKADKQTALDLSDVTMKDKSFQVGADFSGANMSNMKIVNCEFPKANFNNADFSGSIIQNSSFAGANMSEVNMSGITINKSDFSNVNARFANMDDAVIANSNTRNMDATYASTNDILMVNNNILEAGKVKTVEDNFSFSQENERSFC